MNDPVVMSLAVIGGTMLVHALSRWQLLRRAGRAATAGAENTWLHATFALSLWSAAGIALLWVWGAEERAADVATRFLDAGFSLAGIKFVPVRIVLGIVLAAVLIRLVRRLRFHLGNSWLRGDQWEPAARESMATLFGYAGTVLAVLAGVATAGFSLTNLAIVAGALSVGIGFGLQNIVNNFVSGLILLSERPIRRGDFVRVSGIEGEVRRVHIRATEIETLDRVSVIVPNSELIANPVHNWRLRDPYLRIIIPIGVAYGSDTTLVSKTLRELGKDHPLTLPDNTPGVPDTHVYFTDFGDSALLFELRTFIRDVSKRASVASDLRFAIDRAFREHNITIPFPQRDVWMKPHVDA